MPKRSPNAGLFTGYWLDMAGNRIRRIYRSEYPELYRLHRLCLESVPSVPLAADRWVRTEGGYAKLSFPGRAEFVESQV